MGISIPWYDNIQLMALAIYAPNLMTETREFWEKIHQKVTTDPTMKPNIMLGV